MRELHVVATSEDGRHVVLATRKGAANGDFRVAIDDRLSAAVRGDLPRPGEEEPAVVTPKEIQARLRAGETTEEIAASAGVPVAKIERYAGPVLSERERVIAQARAGVVSRSRLGDSALPLGEAVDRHLADTTGVRLETVEWFARREDTGSWLVELSYVSQARKRSAVWRYDVARREVTATDAQSAALAHVEPGGRRTRTPDHVAAHVPASRPAARPAARRATPARTTPTVAAGRTIAARPVPPVRAAAPVPKAAAAGKAAQVATDKAAAAAAARREAARVVAQERTAKAAAAEAARVAAAAEKAAAAEARAAEQRAAKEAAAAKEAREQARKAKAAAAKKAQAEAARKAKAEAKAEAERRAKAEADKKAKAEAARKAKAAAEQKAKAAAEAKAAEAARAAEEARRAREAEEAAAAKAAEEAMAVAEAVPAGPPTLRVVGAEDAPVRRGPKEPPAAARTAPARVAGQRASVPGWADVLLSTAPVARSTEPERDED